MSNYFDPKYLPLISEECAEVIQAASKCQRFGMGDFFPGYNGGRTNEDQLSVEIGDVLGILDAAFPNWENDMEVRISRERKVEKLKSYGPYGTYKGVGNE